MKMIKVLQLATVLMFVAMVVIGLVIVFTAPDKIISFREFAGIIWPIFLMEVVPALIGKPLTEYVRAKAAALAPAAAPAAVSPSG